MLNTVHAVVLVVVIAAICATGCADTRDDSLWQQEFGISKCALVPTGRNQFFILEPGFQIVLEGGNEKVMITVLDETREVDGVVTRVIEEREWKNGKLIEASRNFFAICESTEDVFYFGEEVDMYENGVLVSHSGAWLAGENDARAGLIMPGEPTRDMMYYQEVAPGRAMDRAEVLSLDKTLKTPAGVFENCLQTKETTPLNRSEKDYKTYAPGIGLIQDERLLLTQYGFVELED